MMNNLVTVMKRSLNSVPGDRRGGWFPIIKEADTGNWQKNIEVRKEDMLAYPAVYACMTLIAGDISKLGLNLTQKDSEGIWNQIENPAYSPVLRKPNRFQTRIQFYSNWILSLLTYGNTYVVKKRDLRGVVNELFILDPCRVQVLVSDSGEIFYELNADNITGIEEPVRVPARDIIHDRMNCLYHPLVGIPPLYAAAMTVYQGMKIVESNSHFFSNHGRPGGILTAAGAVSDETVEQLKTYWEANYTGNNAGKVAVLADGLSYSAFQTASASDSQVIEQLKWTALVVCSVFHVPPYMIGVGDTPAHNNIQSLTIQYYNQALQSLIENIELCLDEGLSLPQGMGVEFDIDTLFRMDTSTLITSQSEAVKGGLKMPNEARKKLNLPSIEGGDTVYLQQQMYSLQALAKRDAKEDPFAKSGQTTVASNETDEENPEDSEVTERFVSELKIKAAERFNYA